MRPDFNIVAENKPVTEILRKSLISLRITDESGTMSDEAEMHVEYGSSFSELQGELEIFLGYKETSLLLMGIYTASEVTVQCPPQTVMVRCHAANFKTSIKEKTSKEWENITIGNLVKEIAQKHGYESKVAEKFQNVFIENISQTDESDISFLKGLGRNHDALVKPVGGHIIFIPRGEGKSAFGKVWGTTVLTPKDVINWKVNFNVRNKYKSVIAKWYSYEKGKTIEEKVGNEGTSYTIQTPYSNAESAINAATAKLKQLKRSEAMLDVTMPGNPELFAESKIKLLGFCQEVEGDWIINRAEHILDNRGYQTIVSATIK